MHMVSSAVDYLAISPIGNVRFTLDGDWYHSKCTTRISTQRVFIPVVVDYAF